VGLGWIRGGERTLPRYKAPLITEKTMGCLDPTAQNKRGLKYGRKVTRILKKKSMVGKKKITRGNPQPVTLRLERTRHHTHQAQKKKDGNKRSRKERKRGGVEVNLRTHRHTRDKITGFLNLSKSGWKWGNTKGFIIKKKG